LIVVIIVIFQAIMRSRCTTIITVRYTLWLFLLIRFNRILGFRTTGYKRV